MSIQEINNTTAEQINKSTCIIAFGGYDNVALNDIASKYNE